MSTSEPLLQSGAQVAIDQTVTPGDLASEYAVTSGENYPSVLATPAMLALLERACAQLLQPLLKPDQLSVGAAVEITHTAPTAVGETVRAEARFSHLDGRLYWFDVTVRDAAGLIGQGRHARAIVSQTMVSVRAETRRAAPPVPAPATF
ncbi:hypothetical protein RD110_09030 [Rhodoferax koreense]|uniref:Fluoroacetyl-CoA-specific thioesterase-like domain-containing protein n=1 Tax=Rhodoferax koreensis TaxID=1842727 RepID=A0A1P8JU93_9BURK|nr:hotdog domain-containing protein [Rhodoferax koreense]APW37317.1 hypothetical protein RD110_09030 [Rhodoferax koreense]